MKNKNIFLLHAIRCYTPYTDPLPPRGEENSQILWSRKTNNLNMGWLDCHLHEFYVKDPLTRKKIKIGIPTEEEFSIKVHRSWKGYPFEILDQLREEDCITGSKPAKSVYLTEKGTTKAKELMVKYVNEK